MTNNPSEPGGEKEFSSRLSVKSEKAGLSRRVFFFFLQTEEEEEAAPSLAPARASSCKWSASSSWLSGSCACS